jgi:hypothetical protein
MEPTLRGIIDLNAWHHAIHQVAGDMAVRFNRATIKDLQRWMHELRAVAELIEGQIQAQEQSCDKS